MNMVLSAPKVSTGFAERLAMLSTPAAYPDNPKSVRVIETHLSYVFLTDHYAYKMKKPIRYENVDFTSLESRMADAREEIRLNTRLAKDLYFGIVPVAYSPAKGLRVEAPGEVVDCMIKMRRLPADRMLDSLIKKRKLTQTDICRVAARLADFYKRATPILRSPDEYRHMLEVQMEINFRDLGVCSSLDQSCLKMLRRKQRGFLHEAFFLLSERAEGGHIVDGHGDLRPEHICIEDGRPPVIFDCLQFDSVLRTIDVVDELSFLALECERIGSPEVGPMLLKVYCEATGDDPAAGVIHFYKSCRATMWARLAIWRTRELQKQDHGKWIERANEYLRLAENHANRMDIC